MGRGPNGEALLLTTDGKLRIYDPANGTELGSVQLMNTWSESETWQDPRPALWVDGKTAYVTDPETKKLHAGVTLGCFSSKDPHEHRPAAGS